MDSPPLSGYKVDLRHMRNGPIKNISDYIYQPTWTIKQGIDLLATFKVESMYDNESDRMSNLENSWSEICKILHVTLNSYEYRAKTFLIRARTYEDPDTPNFYFSDSYDSELYPDGFIDWARAMSMHVPDEFYQKLMLAQERHKLGRKTGNVADTLTAKERRELGKLRREQENFDLAIKATVRAVQHCIKVNKRVKRREFFDLLTRGKEGISKELLERILPLLPPEYRETAGAPSTDKMGDPNEPETAVL